MAITKISGRQDILVAELAFTYADLTDAVAVGAINVPVNARVVGGDVVVDTVWNSATTDVLDVGDGVDDNRYTGSQINLAALGRTALTLTGYKYTVADAIDLKWNGTGTAPTTGAARIQVFYTIENRALETQTGT